MKFHVQQIASYM